VTGDERDRLGLRGFSTHSNRRTWATKLDKAGVRLKTIQYLGGWTSMATLQRYLEVSEEEKADTIGKRGTSSFGTETCAKAESYAGSGFQNSIF